MSNNPESTYSEVTLQKPIAKSHEHEESVFTAIEREKKLRRNLSRYFSVIAICLCFYILILDNVKDLNITSSAATYTTTGLTGIFALAIVYLMAKSGYKLSAFGFTLRNWRQSVTEGILFTLPLLALAFLIKYLLIHYVSAYHGLPLIELDKGVVKAHLEGTTEGRTVWLETLFLYVLIIAPLQEFMVRCGLQKALTIFLSGKHKVFFAILVSCIIFSTVHSAYPPLMIILSFIGGLFWGWLFYRHNTVIGAAISHGLVGVCLFWVLGLF